MGIFAVAASASAESFELSDSDLMDAAITDRRLLQHLMSQMDLDHNGKLTKEEIFGDGESSFFDENMPVLDRDGDGMLDLEEFRHFIKLGKQDDQLDLSGDSDELERIRQQDEEEDYLRI